MTEGNEVELEDCWDCRIAGFQNYRKGRVAEGSSEEEGKPSFLQSCNPAILQFCNSAILIDYGPLRSSMPMTAQSTAPLNDPFSGNDVATGTARSTKAIVAAVPPLPCNTSARSV
jgi:hypothetical protein